MVYLEMKTEKVAIQEKGAELTSIVKETQTEYLWNADPAYWKDMRRYYFPARGG